MSTIDSTTSTTATPNQIQRSTGGTLGKDDFLKLFVAQLQHQDPMNPMQDQDFMGQMAQFTSVEQLTNMATSIKLMNTASQSTQSIALIGKTVSWKKEDGTTGEGVAKSVSFADGKITIAVGDATITPSEIESVR